MLRICPGIFRISRIELRVVLGKVKIYRNIRKYLEALRNEGACPGGLMMGNSEGLQLIRICGKRSESSMFSYIQKASGQGYE